MSINRKVLLALFFALLLGSSLRADTVTFDEDPIGFQLLGFNSKDSAFLSFNIAFADPTYAASKLFVFENPVTYSGNALQLSGYIPDRLQFDFTHPVNFLSLSFGGDTVPPLIAVLTLFEGAIEVGQTTMQANGDNLLNQSLTYSGRSFNRAVLGFEGGGVGAESVDNIQFGLAVPEPGSSGLVVVGLLTLSRLKRAPQVCVRPASLGLHHEERL